MNHAPTTEEVWRLLSRKLHGFLRARVGDEHTADDLLQETFVRIHQKLGEVRDEHRLAAWVFQIARNLVTDHFRARAGAANATPREPADPSSEAGNANDEVRAWLPLALELLPDPYREAVRLYEMEGLTHVEIANRLGISVSGAKSRVQRGRVKLKALIDACCAFELDRRGNVLDYERRSDPDCC